MADTEEVIARMLKENTGRHMLDSGGAYGRHWEQNQDRNFEEEPATTMRVWLDGDIEITHNVYHWLKERVTYDEHIDELFHRWANLPSNKDKHWLELMELFADKYSESSERWTVNTYNGEDLLSQVLQYTEFSMRGSRYVLLQIHGGCDVRGGYTAPRVFEVDYAGLSDNANATIYCTRPYRKVDTLLGVEHEEPHSWYTDDGYNWYPNNYDPELKNFEWIEVEDEPKPGAIYYSREDNAVYCPVCAYKMEAGF